MVGDKTDLEIEAFIGARIMREQTARTQQRVDRRIPASHIIAYARNNQPTLNLAIERMLLQSASTRALYTAALEHNALGVSRVAIAAADELLPERSFGHAHLKVVEDAGNDWLVLTLGEQKLIPHLMEVRRRDGVGARIRLPEPIGGIIQLPLDPGFPEMVILREMLCDPQSMLFLI